MVCRRESLVWKSSRPSVATVSRGTITARRRGNAVISVNVLKNGKRLARRVCKLRVAEAPVVVASLGVSGEESEHIAEVGYGYWKEKCTSDQQDRSANAGTELAEPLSS
ncbi:MAG: hypothetical protein V8S22_05470 [Lachnospiraceae bacterium]